MLVFTAIAVITPDLWWFLLSFEAKRLVFTAKAVKRANQPT
jgi:hypothetical protein